MLAAMCSGDWYLHSLQRITGELALEKLLR